MIFSKVSFVLDEYVVALPLGAFELSLTVAQ